MLLKKVYSFSFCCFILQNVFGQPPRLVIPVGHEFYVLHANFSPNGKQAVTVGHYYYGIKLWDISTGKLLLDIRDAKSPEFSFDNKKIVTAGLDSTAKVWDAATGKLLLILKGHRGKVESSEFSSDGKKIITASSDSTAKIWDAYSGKLLTTLEGHMNGLTTAKFNMDGRQSVTAAKDGYSSVWDVATGELITSVYCNAEINFSNFSPDGKNVISILSNGSGIIWDAISGKSLIDLVKSNGIASAQFSNNGKNVLTACLDSTAKIWDVESGKLLAVMKGHTDRVETAQFSPDNRTVLTSSWDNSLKLWNASNGSFLQNFNGHIASVFEGRFSADGRRIVSASRDKTAKIWDTNTGKSLLDLRGYSVATPYSAYSKDGKKILTVSPTYKKGMVNIWDAKSLKKLFTLRGTDAKFSPNSKKVITITSDTTLVVWDVLDGRKLTAIQIPARAKTFQFSLDGSKIITTTNDSCAYIWDAISGTFINKLKGYASWQRTRLFKLEGEKSIYFSVNGKNAAVLDVVSNKVLANLKGTNFINLGAPEFSPDNRKIITSNSVTNFATIWDIKSGKQLSDLVGHFFWVRGAHFSPDSKKILTSSYDHTCKIWDANTSKSLLNIILLDSNDYILQTSSGYYQSTPRATKLLHYVTKDLKVITFEQLDVKYNRPDKVLEAIGNTDTSLIKSYRKAWEKRIKKLKIDTTQFREGYSAPEVDFINRDSIDYEQKQPTLSLHLNGMDSSYLLDRFNIWVNEVPLYGQRGIDIRKRNHTTLDTTISVKLSEGENRIEASIININGTESYRKPLLLNYTPSNMQKELVHFVGIGIDKFSDNKYNLQYSAKDIRDLSIKFKERFGDNITIDTLFDENVTVSNVKALKQKLFKTTENDKVIIAYSGHGMLSKDYDYYLSTYSINFDKPEQNGLSYDELENLLDSIPARKKLMLIDACHSGEVDKEDLITLNASSDSLIKGLNPIAYKEQGHLGLKNSFELMQSLFVNVGKSTGATIISAAAGTQFALERNDLKNGVFTYSILEAMNKYPTLRISELKKFVGERVEQLTKGLQKPTSRNETIAVDWNVW